MKKLLFVFLTVWIIMPSNLAQAHYNERVQIKEFTKIFASEEDNLQVTSSIQTPAEHVREDKDWPIVRVERYKYVDEETGLMHEHTTIWREATPGYTPSGDQFGVCSENAIATAAKVNSSRAACTSVGYVSRDDVDTIYYNGTSVSHHIVHYAEKFCEGGCGNRQLYRAYKVSRSWTRTSVNWTIKNATMEWGCGAACIKCDSSEWSWIYPWGPTTITWFNNTQSYVYTTTHNSLPAVEDLFEDVLKAISRSDAYYSGSKKGSTYVNAAYP